MLCNNNNICEICVEFELDKCDCNILKNNLLNNVTINLTKKVINNAVCKDTINNNMTNLILNCVNNKFDCYNKFFEENNIVNIMKSIENDIIILVEKHEFKEIRDYLKSLIENNMCFYEDAYDRLQYNIIKKMRKEHELMSSINKIFISGDISIIRKCTCLIYKKSINKLQQIYEESEKINDDNMWILFYCPNCESYNNINATICKDCNYNIDYKEYVKKYHIYYNFGVNSIEYKEKYNMVQNLNTYISKMKDYLEINKNCDIDTLNITLTNDMIEIYNRITEINNYFDSHKNDYMELYEKWKIYNYYWLNIKENIEETYENNRYIMFEKYDFNFEEWYDKRKYFYYIYQLDCGINKNEFQLEILQSILDFSHPELPKSLNNDMRYYENKFYEWYISIRTNYRYKRI